MKLVAIRNTLMISAAVVSSFFVPRIRPAGFSSVSSGSPSTCGMTATPVSKPDRPSASLGKTSSATPTMATTFPCSAVRALDQSVTTCAAVATCHRPTTTTTALRARYRPTRTTATPIASRKPLRNTAPSRATSTSVTTICCPCSTLGTCGFSTRWVEASAADRVMVIRKSVAAKPSRVRTNSLPFQNDSRRSSMAIEPSPCGLSSATRRYTGSAPARVTITSTIVATGDSSPAASAAMPG